MNRTANVIFLLVISFSFFSPGVSTMIKIFRGKSVKMSDTENRRLVIPRDICLVDSLSKKSKKIEALVEDQLSNRYWVKNIYSRTMVFGFKHSPLRRVVLGKDGYWYLLSSLWKGHLAKFESMEHRLSLKTIEYLSRSYLQFCRKMKKKNILVTTIIIPTKLYLLPEKLPAYFSKLMFRQNERSVTRLVKSIVRRGAGICYPFQIAKKLPADRIFHKKSFHWLTEGAQLLLYHQFSKENPFESIGIPVMPLSEGQVQYIKKSFDMTGLLGCGEVSYLKKSFNLPHSVTFISNDLVKTARDKFMRLPDRLNLYKSSNLNDFKVLFVTDSFGIASRTYISQYFETTIHVNINGFRSKNVSVEELATFFSPDVIVFLFNDSRVLSPFLLNRLWSMKKSQKQR